jgi:UDP-glucose 4-epimerase
MIKEPLERILVLGGSGFIGKALIAGLLKQGCKVIATYYSHCPDIIKGEEVTWIHWDATTGLLPGIAWHDIDAAIHLANYSDQRKFPFETRQMYRIIIESTFNLLEKAYINNIKRVVISSTGDVLGNTDVLSDENMHYAPKSFYGSAKACAELMADAYSSMISTVALRFYYPYGKGGERFLVGRLVQMVKDGKEISIEGDAGIVINPVHLNDLVKGTLLALGSTASGVFHLTGPDCISLRTLLERAGKLIGKTPLIKSMPGKIPGGHAGLYDRSKNLLGYLPSMSLDEGLKDLL